MFATIIFNGIILLMVAAFFAGYLVGKNQAKNKPQVSDKSNLPIAATAAPTSLAPVSAAKQPALSPDNKHQRDLQNINIVLYVASFLLVAAAVLFIGTNLPDIVKVFGAWLVTISFYTAGLWLHETSLRLKPAAVAFVGTGLALLPFAGLATNLFIVHQATTSWFITSCIGLLAFMYATYKLRAQVLAYLSLGFVFSLAVSSVAVLQVPLVWSFVVIIVVASLLNVLAYLKPSLLSDVFLKPIDQSGQIAVPLALLGSLVIYGQLDLWQYGLITAVAALHYGVAALRPVEARYRQAYIFAARLLAMVSILIFSYDQSQSWPTTGLILSLLASMQVIISAVIVKRKSNDYDLAWLWLGMGLQAVAIFGWSGLADRAVWTTGSLVLILTTSSTVALYLRKSRYSSIGLLAAAALTIQVGQDLIQPPLKNYLISLLFVAASAAMLAARTFWCKTGERLEVAASATALYGVFSLFFILGQPAGWQAAVLTALAAIVAFASSVEKQPNFYIVTNLLVLFAAHALSDSFTIGQASNWLVAAGISGSIFYLARFYFGSINDLLRKNIMMIFGLAVFIVFGLAFVFGDQTVPAAIMLIGASILLAIESWLNKRLLFTQVALLIATFAAQRLIAHSYDSNFLIYTHWWALTLGIVALMSAKNKQYKAAKGWLIAGLLFMSLPSGLFALGDPAKYQLIFLLEHVLLLLAGALASYRLATIWGAVGVALSVLYLLKNYTFILVALIAIGLIGFAIWRLLAKSSPHK